MVPGTAVVAGPRCGVALTSCVSCPGKDERAVAWIECAQAVVCCTGVLHSVEVVYLCVRSGAGCESALIDAMDNIFRDGEGRRIEYGWLIHVVPETIDAVPMKTAIERAPPCTGLLASEIRKDTGTGPDFAGVDGTIRILDEMVACQASVKGAVVVSWKIRDVQVGDGDNVKVFRLELSKHSGKIREGRCVDCKGSIFLLEIDVEINRICRNRIRTKAISDFENARLREVAISRLLKAESPERRQRRSSREPCICFHDLLGRRAVEQVVVQRAGSGAEGVDSG